MIWKFTQGTLIAHIVLDEEKGATLCGRTGLKFEASVCPKFLLQEQYKCKTCLKRLREGSGSK